MPAAGCHQQQQQMSAAKPLLSLMGLCGTLLTWHHGWLEQASVQPPCPGHPRGCHLPQQAERVLVTAEPSLPWPSSGPTAVVRRWSAVGVLV